MKGSWHYFLILLGSHLVFGYNTPTSVYFANKLLILLLWWTPQTHHQSSTLAVLNNHSGNSFSLIPARRIGTAHVHGHAQQRCDKVQCVVKHMAVPIKCWSTSHVGGSQETLCLVLSIQVMHYINTLTKFWILNMYVSNILPALQCTFHKHLFSTSYSPSMLYIQPSIDVPVLTEF